jgi:hypothetical protein
MFFSKSCRFWKVKNKLKCIDVKCILCNKVVEPDLYKGCASGSGIDNSSSEIFQHEPATPLLSADDIFVFCWWQYVTYHLYFFIEPSHTASKMLWAALERQRLTSLFIHPSWGFKNLNYIIRMVMVQRVGGGGAQGDENRDCGRSSYSRDFNLETHYPDSPWLVPFDHEGRLKPPIVR